MPRASGLGRRYALGVGGRGARDELRAVLLKLSLGPSLDNAVEGRWRGGEWDLKVSSFLSTEKRI